MNWAQKRERDGPLDLAQHVALHMSDSYDEEIRFLDDQIGTLLADLRERRLYQETLVIVTSDHGEEFWEHGRIMHGSGLYQEAIHVPLILRYPKAVPVASRVAGTVGLVDIAPTLLGLAGIPAPYPLDGVPLLEPSARRALYGSLDLDGWSAGLRQEGVCIAPDDPVYIYQMRLSTDGNRYPIPDFQDPNPPTNVTGYNVYRSENAALPFESWPLAAYDVPDMDAGLPDSQWVDTSGDVSGSGVWYYQVLAYNAPCGAEGPR